jgi:hypothetical protein
MGVRTSGSTHWRPTRRAVNFLRHEVAALFAAFGPYLLTRHLRLELLGAFADRALAGVVAYGLVDCDGILLTRLYLGRCRAARRRRGSVGAGALTGRVGVARRCCLRASIAVGGDCNQAKNNNGGDDPFRTGPGPP